MPRSIARITLSALAAAGLALTVTPALTATAEDSGGGVPIYCLAPDGIVLTTNTVYEDGVPSPAYWWIDAFTPYGVQTPLPLIEPEHRSMHPTMDAKIEPNFWMVLRALHDPSQTSEDSNTGDIPFVGKGIREGQYPSDDHVFTLFVGPSEETVNGPCEGRFYNADGHQRPASEIYWSPKYVPSAGGSYAPALPGGGTGGGGGGGSSLSS